METVWHLLSPVGVQKPWTSGRRASAAGTDAVIGVLSNRKPNASLLLTTLMKRLTDRGYSTRFYEKLNAATPAGDPLLQRIAKECTSVIVASGD